MIEHSFKVAVVGDAFAQDKLYLESDIMIYRIIYGTSAVSVADGDIYKFHLSKYTQTAFKEIGLNLGTVHSKKIIQEITTSGAEQIEWPKEYSFPEGLEVSTLGKTDTLFFGAESASVGNHTCYCKIYYKLINKKTT